MITVSTRVTRVETYEIKTYWGNGCEKNSLGEGERRRRKKEEEEDEEKNANIISNKYVAVVSWEPTML